MGQNTSMDVESNVSERFRVAWGRLSQCKNSLSCYGYMYLQDGSGSIDALARKTGSCCFFMPFASAESAAEGCMCTDARWSRRIEKA